MINEMVKKSFIDNASKDIRHELMVSEYVRNESLDRAYAVAGYLGMSDSERTAIYDKKRVEVMAELESLGVRL